MSLLNPTLAGAVTKAERAIAFLKIPQLTVEHLRLAMDHFKSAAALAKSHHTVLVELESELSEPGPALFDAAGAPAPGAELVAATGLGLRIEEHPVLTMGVEAYLDFNMKKRETLEEELLFALRLHARARGLDYFALRDLVMDDLGGFDEETFSWLVEQITTSGTFEWPHHCEDCHIDMPSADGTVLCWACKRKREQAAAAQTKKDQKKAAKTAEKKPKATPKPAANPLSAGPEDGEGDE
jgi:hypothetical protein